MLSRQALSSWQAPYFPVSTGQQDLYECTLLLICRQNDRKPTAPRNCVAGDLSLEGVRINQLKLSRSLTGMIQVSDREVQIHAKVGAPLQLCLWRCQQPPCAIRAKVAVDMLQGQRPDESLDVELALPLFQAQPKAAAAPVEQPVRRQNPLGLGDILSVPRFGLGPSLALPSGTSTTSSCQPAVCCLS